MTWGHHLYDRNIRAQNCGDIIEESPPSPLCELSESINLVRNVANPDNLKTFAFVFCASMSVSKDEPPRRSSTRKQQALDPSNTCAPSQG